MRTRLNLALALAAACSGPPDDVPTAVASESVALHARAVPGLETVVRASWGSGTGELGHSLPSEASPECPHSLAIDGLGWIHVLDQVNHRIASFDAADWRYIPITTPNAEDLAVAPSGSFWVLDRGGDGTVSAVSRDGGGTVAVPVRGPGVSSAGRVTALIAAADGAWVEVNNDYTVRLAGPGLEHDARRAIVRGRGALFHVALKASRSDGGVYLRGQPTGPGAAGFRTQVPFTDPVFAIRGLESTQDRIVLAVELVSEGPAPDFAVINARTVYVVLDLVGRELYRFETSASPAAHTPFRALQAAPDGYIYTLTCAPDGAVIARFEP